ncbi:hypothetical protein Tco_1075481 [Tanacetum coccineum]
MTDDFTVSRQNVVVVSNRLDRNALLSSKVNVRGGEDGCGWGWRMLRSPNLVRSSLGMFWMVGVGKWHKEGKAKGKGERRGKEGEEEKKTSKDTEDPSWSTSIKTGSHKCHLQHWKHFGSPYCVVIILDRNIFGPHGTRETKLRGRLLKSFQEYAKYEHVGQDTRSQGGKDDQD